MWRRRAGGRGRQGGGGGGYARLPAAEGAAGHAGQKRDESASQAGVLATLVLAWRYVEADARRNPRSLAVAVLTVALVVAFVCVLRNAVSQSPLVFLKLAENQLGEMDVLLVPRAAPAGAPDAAPGAAPGFALLNETAIAAALAGVRAVKGVAPRWVSVATLGEPGGGGGGGGGDGDNRTAVVGVLYLDTAAERRAGIGREWDRPALGVGECYVSHGALREVGASKGARLEVVSSLVQLAETVQSGGAGLAGDAAVGDVADVGGGGGGDAGGGSDGQDDDPGEDNAGGGGGGAAVDAATALLRRVVERADPGAWDTPLVDVPGGGGNLTVDPSRLPEVNLTGLLELAERRLPPGSPLLDGLERLVNQTEEALRDADADGGVDLGAAVPGALTVGDLLGAVAGPALARARVRQACVVRGSVASPDGKWPASLGSVVVYESSSLGVAADRAAAAALSALRNVTRLGEALLAAPGPLLGDEARERLARVLRGNGTAAAALAEAREAGLRPSEHALTAVVMNRGRIDAYTRDAAGLGRAMAKFSDALALRLGLWYPAQFSAPLAAVMQRTMVLRYLLDNVFWTISAVVVVLGVLLIYSLLLEDVEAKTYEYGMLRALGMRSRSLVAVILLRAALAAGPGVAAGLFFAWLANIPVALRVAHFSALPARLALSDEAVALAASVGALMPLVANLVPISRALSAVLRDSLDVLHQASGAAVVSVQRLESLGVSAWQTAAAALLVGAGFVTFYLVPYAFVFQRVPLFLGLLTGVLLGMLGGLCVLAGLLQPPLERAFLALMTACGPHRTLRPVVRKNLAGHRRRNAKTAVMFTLCQAFIVFASVMFLLQERSISDNVRVVLGADLVVRAPSHRPDLVLDEAPLRELLAASPLVEAFTFVTPRLRGCVPTVGRVHFGSLPGFPHAHVHVYAVERNYLDTVYSELYHAAEIAGGAARRGGTLPDGRVDPIRGLYAAEEARMAGGGGGDGGDADPVPQGVGSGVRHGSGARVLALAGLLPEPGRYPGLARWAAGGPPPRQSLEHAYRSAINVIGSAALTSAAGLGPGTPLQFAVQWFRPSEDGGDSRRGHEDSGRAVWMARAEAFLVKLPGFARYSSRQLAARHSPLLLTVGEFARVVNETYARAGLPPPPAARAVPKQRLLVRMRAGAGAQDREDVADALRPLLRDDQVRVVDTARLVETTALAVDLLTLFFEVAGGVALLMAAFILWQSVTANVREHGWEFGVLRAVGLTAAQAVMVHVYEALALVLASLLLGTGVGLVVAVSLTLQTHMFDELPFSFQFPYAVFFGMLALACALAVAASAVPARAMLRKPIARVLRRMD